MQRVASTSSADCQQPTNLWTASDATEPPEWAMTLPEPQRDEISLLLMTYPEAVAFPSKHHDDDTASAATMIKMHIDSTNVQAHLLITLQRPPSTTTTGRKSNTAAVAAAADDDNEDMGPPALTEEEELANTMPDVHLSSTNASPEVMDECKETLRQNLVTLHEAGGGSGIPLLTIFNEACEVMANLPISLQSDNFACCVDCNSRRLKAGHSKIPQPIRFIDKGTTAECLACKGKNVVLVPSMRLNVEQLCSMCFCEDNPLIFMECGCKSCFTCFQRFADISTGGGVVKRHTRSKLFGVPCPNHENTVIVDYGLLKLCEPRVFFRFNMFSTQQGAKQIGAYSCPVPGCCGLPMFAELLGGLVRCAYCKRWSCPGCQQEAINCRCEQLTRDQSVNWISLRMPFDNNRISLDAPVVSESATKAQVLCIFGEERIQVELYYADGKWEQHLTEKLKTVIYDDKYFINIYHPEERGRCFFFMFHGQPLNPTRTLRHVGLFTGAIIFALVYEPQKDRRRSGEMELWNFRRSMRITDGRCKTPDDVKGLQKGNFKKCPFCGRPVAHYHGHGCHHIGAHGSCCGKPWCFVCLKAWPCTKCPLFCTLKCGCPPCVDCKPMMPCAQCSGCLVCQPGKSLNHFA